MRLAILLLIVFCNLSCSSYSQKNVTEESLQNTKWKNIIADDCINIYEFKSDSSYTFFSCEMQDDFFGTYYLENDTLIIIQEGSKYDETLPKESIHRAERKKYKVLVKRDRLTHISMSDWINNKWVKSDFKFDEGYYFTKEK